MRRNLWPGAPRGTNRSPSAPVPLPVLRKLFSSPFRYVDHEFTNTRAQSYFRFHPTVESGTNMGAPTSPPSLLRLPPELLYHIFDYLFPTHSLARAGTSYSDSIDVPTALDNVSLTSHYLRAQVQAWANHWLRAHASITGYKDLKTTRLQGKRDFLRGKKGLLTWAERHCAFCGKRSTRSAILMNGLRCCVDCDWKEWPDKITKTVAKKEYNLQEHQLVGKQLPMPERGAGVNISGLRYGMYYSMGVLTTMYLKSDVERLATVVHGDLERYRRNKQWLVDERKRKKAAKKEREREADAAWFERTIVVNDD